MGNWPLVLAIRWLRRMRCSEEVGSSNKDKQEEATLHACKQLIPLPSRLDSWPFCLLACLSCAWCGAMKLALAQQSAVQELGRPLKSPRVRETITNYIDTKGPPTTPYWETTTNTTTITTSWSNKVQEAASQQMSSHHQLTEGMGVAPTGVESAVFFSLLQLFVLGEKCMYKCPDILIGFRWG